MSCDNCALGKYDRDIIEIFNLYNMVFDKLFPLEVNLNLWLPDFWEMSKYEALSLIKQFKLINRVVNEHSQMKAEAEARKRALKQRLAARKRR